MSLPPRVLLETMTSRDISEMVAFLQLVDRGPRSNSSKPEKKQQSSEEMKSVMMSIMDSNNKIVNLNKGRS